MIWANRLAIVILAPCVALLGCRDHLYAHTIRGQVIAPNETDTVEAEWSSGSEPLGYFAEVEIAIEGEVE